MLRKFFLSMMVAGSFAFPLGTAAEAAIADSPFVSADHVTHVAPVEDANFIWGGRTFCWYPAGWNGPGFYVCGLQWSVGVGWGGPWGWNGWGGGWRSGWNGHGWHRGMTVHHHHHHHRPGNRPGHGNNRPGHGNNRPGHGNNRPGHGNNRPGHGNNRPGHGNNRPGHGGNRPGHGGRPGGGGGGHRPGGGGGGNRGGGNRGGGGGQRRRSELPSQPKIIATATFDYASASSAPYEVVVSF